VPVVPPGDPSDTLEKAMAELDRIGLAKASTYDNVSAPWRSRPASEKLRRLAEKMHIDLPENVRAGDVSDAIAVKMNGSKVNRTDDEHERRRTEELGVKEQADRGLGVEPGGGLHRHSRIRRCGAPCSVRSQRQGRHHRHTGRLLAGQGRQDGRECF